ncbi:MAG: aspartyl protease family protein [Phycisphaerae bacterium]|jgi:hypothetical protein
MFLIPTGARADNPWTDEVAPAIAKATDAGTVEAYAEALDVTWRADDWLAALPLAREAIAKHPEAAELQARAARTFWRAGNIAEAEATLKRVPGRTTDRVALGMMIVVNLAHGDRSAALRAASHLESLDDLTAEDVFAIVTARSTTGHLDGMTDLLRRVQELTDPAHGYPELHFAEQLEGMPEFFAAIGTEPVNRVSKCGSARMPVLPLFNLPSCQATINGHGPYRLIVDTGGSITLSLDSAVAEEIGLESITQSSVHGVAGKTEAGQALVDELCIGDITCRRVLTRTFGVRQAVANSADGILGTGIFSDNRMVLDFFDGRLVVQPSTARPAAGQELDARIIGDGKLIALATLHDEPVAALLDSGADLLAAAPSRLQRLYPGREFRTASAALPMGVGSEQNPEISLTPGLDFAIGGRLYENYGGLGLDVLDRLLGPLLGMQTDVLVGMPVMREMKTLSVDFARCRMWVDWLDEQ